MSDDGPFDGVGRYAHKVWSENLLNRSEFNIFNHGVPNLVLLGGESGLEVVIIELRNRGIDVRVVPGIRSYDCLPVPLSVSRRSVSVDATYIADDPYANSLYSWRGDLRRSFEGYDTALGVFQLPVDNGSMKLAPKVLAIKRRGIFRPEFAKPPEEMNPQP